MGILDKTIAVISPKWGAQRAKNRYVMNAYEAAMPNRTHKAKRESQGANVSTNLKVSWRIPRLVGVISFK